jgi:hypothetical protein
MVEETHRAGKLVQWEEFAGEFVEGAVESEG